MEELLTKDNLEYIERTREVAEKYVRPVAAELDKDQTYPWKVLEKIKEANLMGVWIPKEYGGRGAGILNLCLVVEQLSRACGGFGVAYAVNALGTFPIIVGGTEDQKQKWLPQVASGDRLVAFCLSELNAGSDAGSVKTRAVRDGDEYVINGDKKWTTNADAAEIYTAYCVTDPEKGSRGVSAILVEKGTPGFTVGKEEDKLGIRCVSVHEMHFKDCRVPVENLLFGREGAGFANAMQTLDRARPGVAAQALGLAQGALDIAVDYAQNNMIGDEPISHSQGVQFMLADMATQVEAARHLVYTSARAIDAGARKFSKISAMAKLYASDVAMKVTTDAVQICGHNGYSKDYPIEKYMRDAKITQIYEGTNQVQRLVVARNLLKESSGG